MRGSWANISKNRLIFVVIAVLTFCTVWIGYGLLESAKYEQQAKDKISEYTEYTREKVTQACAASDKIENIKCVDEAFKAKREYEYNQSDLLAQRQSALWAYIMAAAAVIGIALSAVGIFLVYTTFHETRKANEIANKSIRPWLIVESFTIKRLLVHNIINKDGKFAIVEAEIALKNIGKAPAYGFRRHGGPVKNIDEADKMAYPITFIGDCLAPNQEITVLIIGKTEIYNWSGEPDEVGFFKHIDFMVSLTYASQKDSDPHETRQFWRIGSRVDENLVMWGTTDIDEGKIDAELAFTTRMT